MYDSRLGDITSVKILNDYENLDNFKIRLMDAGDPDAYELKKGEQVYFNVEAPNTNNCQVFYSGAVVQQVDFNDGKSSDDLNMPNSESKYNDKNTITYASSNGNTSVLVDFTNKIVNTIPDNDGIDGGPAAIIEAEVFEDSFGGDIFLGITVRKQS